MKTMMALLGGLMLLAHANIASAIVPFKPVRRQIYNEAKQEGILTGLKKPSLRLTYNKARTTVTASIFSIGRQWPTLQDARMLQKTATFTLNNLPDGTLASPKKVAGQVWQQIYHLD